ncbi:flagellar hook-associated protein FlgL [Laribacter hongkongensis]|uniref:flagellar hook-associated protein FlgL n=1 Tax=Laribacter hongkongensis TaxID=168471 RepID=UPI001B42760A|nr:flagellar hook-associated protein FlgL [Laribacter hongkongensis]MBP9528526.1 flagellar hook-associated protein FlgL [Laribacter sp.]MCG8991534.1 flagellar hook-associated protein FlgL [Laribacter hongkongensis]MCG8996787.1 flagellar hook-associated protein FlgL [Laribacter hongkongensis]MCG9001184.1 flagellar hook-associated protein FlgL [Laribacter hongkongensis]MCG9003120.1 flagellar hook-associated protein FlgL [Laribacter hongkongensis]
MRISTNSTFLQGSYGVSIQQSLMSQLNVQLSTLKRVNTPSDDPVAAARILDVSQSDARNSQFITNTKTADSALEFSSTALSQMAELVTQAKELAVQAGNGSTSDQNLQQMQTVFQKKLEEMVAIANTTDANGKYLFAGTNADTPAYSMVGNTIEYRGNDGQKSLAISDTRQIAISEPGSTIFGNGNNVANPADDDSFFGIMVRFNNLLTAGKNATFGGPPPRTYDQELTAVMAGMDQGLQSVVTAEASVGSRQLEAQNAGNLGEDLSLVYAKTRSNLEDLDVPKAASDLAMAQMALQASQLSFSKVQGMSLFNYI